jgi:hypothetical protein
MGAAPVQEALLARWGITLFPEKDEAGSESLVSFLADLHERAQRMRSVRSA